MARHNTSSCNKKLYSNVIYLYQVIRRTLDKYTVAVYEMFDEQLNLVREEIFDGLKPVTQFHPKSSGVAHQAQLLVRRIDRDMKVG